MSNEDIVKRMFWLAWLAAGSPVGMGFLRDNPNAGEDDVWENVMGGGDHAICRYGPGDTYGDYVFGRMLKLKIRWDDKSITLPRYQPNPAYQAWCLEYPTYESLLQAAKATLG